MTMALLVLLLALLAVVAVMLALLLHRVGNQRRSEGDPGILLLQQQFDALRAQTGQGLADVAGRLDQRLANIDRLMAETVSGIGSRLDSANTTVQSVRTTLGELSQATRQVLDVGRDIRSLQDILRTPKLRGIIGEFFLGDLLRQVVPAHHELQYRFASGEAVDAVIRLGPRLVPVDSKFPLEDFQRLTAETDEESRKVLRRRFVAAVRKHVDAIADKYIRPDEGTFDFALMYIPAENVYYETIIRDSPEDDSVSSHALSRRVIPVSPNSLYAYLQSIVLGLRGFQIEQRAGDILAHLGRLRLEYDRFRGEFEVLGTHLNHARNKYEESARRLDRFGDRLELELAPSDSQPAAEDGQAAAGPTGRKA
ncbi:MAG: DNA recombination protein RmuC [bacterium]